MSDLVTVEVPDIGDYNEVEIIEVLVKIGDSIELDDSLITLESDKASMEIPSPVFGTVSSILVKAGDKVSAGSAIVLIDQPNSSPAEPQGEPESINISQKTNTSASTKASIHTQVLVLGSGPGGYTAAFRAADLGKKVIMIERYSSIGGVCLNVGCIPSKALLHAAQVINETSEMADWGIDFSTPEINIEKLLARKNKVVRQLTTGLKGLAKQRKVEIITGVGEFSGSHEMTVSTAEGKVTVSFDSAIIAAGSQSVKIPGFPYGDNRLIDSTGALELESVRGRMLVIGGGIIGLEMGTVYNALGAKITVVELSDGLIPGCDRDLVRPLEKRLKNQFENIFTGCKVVRMESCDDGIQIWFEGGKAPETDKFDKILLAVGRSPNGAKVGADKAGLEVDDRGFILVDKQQRTNISHIYAIGDVVGQPMLAHKATHEGKVAAEVICGKKSQFDALTIPSVAYTDPEISWMGLTETEAKSQNIHFEKATFPWAASGRSLSIGRNDGLTKVLFDPDTKRILGAGIVGPNAGELIAEAVLALEMGADIEDVALTIHPHPTLSETFNFACEVAEGSCTDIYVPKKNKK